MIASPLANVIGPSVTGFPVGLARLASSSSSSSSSRGRFSAPTDFSASGGGGGASSSSRAGVSSMDGGAVDGGAVASSVVASSALVIAKTETRARECDDRGSGLESQRSRRRRDGRARERESGENDRDGMWDGPGKGGNEMEKIMSVVYKSSTRDGGGETGRRGDDGGHARRAGSAAYERARPESPRAASSGASVMAPVSSSRFGPGWRPV